MKYATRLEFQHTNNIVEYETILLGLCKARAMRIQRLIIKTDSQIVAGYIEKGLQIKISEVSKISAISKRSRKTLRRLHSKKYLKNR